MHDRTAVFMRATGLLLQYSTPLVLLVACGGGGKAESALPTPPAAVTPPCSDGYGSVADRAAIEQAMATGAAADVQRAIAQARSTRGARVGCPEAYPSRSPPDVARPSLDLVRAQWESVHAPALASYRLGCPDIGRGTPSAAIGGYAARRAGGSASAVALPDIARMLEAQQLTPQRSAPVVDTTWGVFGGYLGSGASDACALGGVPGVAVSEWCTRLPTQCPTYAEGLFAGGRFAVADINRAAGAFDGGIGFDQGWSGVMMIEAAQDDPDAARRAQWRAAALLAGEWSAAEPPVRNHNYTAKNVWLLARLYGWTGEARWRAALLDKLDRNLLPGVLMDQDGDGRVDAPGPAVSFAELAPVAQVPGRMWDAHNAVTHYQGMNAVGVVEAYVALRDRGDTAAARVRPYALAMLDNLAREFLQLGLPDSSASQREAGLALLAGSWKIARAESLARPAWEQALDAAWNTGITRAPGAGTSFAGLYLAYRSGADYRDAAAASGSLPR
jgi:hypothetical protein